jgi:hypothetical protein
MSGWGRSMAARMPARMWASVADRARAIRILKESFVEGRLAFGEFEERVGQAIASRDFRELLALYDDLPVGLFDRLPAHPLDPRPTVKGAFASTWPPPR